MEEFFYSVAILVFVLKCIGLVKKEYMNPYLQKKLTCLSDKFTSWVDRAAGTSTKVWHSRLTVFFLALAIVPPLVAIFWPGEAIDLLYFKYSSMIGVVSWMSIEWREKWNEFLFVMLGLGVAFALVGLVVPILEFYDLVDTLVPLQASWREEYRELIQTRGIWKTLGTGLLTAGIILIATVLSAISISGMLGTVYAAIMVPRIFIMSAKWIAPNHSLEMLRVLIVIILGVVLILLGK